MSLRKSSLTLVLILGLAADVSAATLKEAVDKFRSIRLVRDSTREIQPLDLTLPGLHVHLESGKLAPLSPLRLDDTSFVCAAYFTGKAKVTFTSPVDVERAQIRRFFDADTLTRDVEEGLLVFSDRLYDSLFSAWPKAGKEIKKKYETSARTLLHQLFESKDDYLGVMLYRALTAPLSHPYYVFHFKPHSRPRFLYLYDPFDRDEVVLRHYHDLPGESFMEVVSAYPRQVTADHRGINGEHKALLRALHYDIDTKISMQGAFTAQATVRFEVGPSGGQFDILTLHPDLRVTSVRMADSTPVDFHGHAEKKGNPVPLYLHWPHPLSPGDTVDVVFEYGGEVSKEARGYFYVTASAQWYPSSVERGRATFALDFRTPSSYEFVATGTLTEDAREDDVRHTRWEVERPARNVSFCIGPTNRFEHRDSSGLKVELYYTPELHRDPSLLPLTTGGHLEKEVAGDVVSALKLYTEMFGPYALDHLRVSEIIALHGEAFPGLIHMGLPTWVQADTQGEQKVFRAHEVAHQWWGVEVGYDSYRDQWLSEAFAEYSALLYLERKRGSTELFRALAGYRESIYSVRAYAFGHGERSGAIALGYRASSSRTEGDFDLVVYKKGAYVLHMLRLLLTDLATDDDRPFFRLLSEFYKTYRGKDATTADFQHLAERYAGENLDWFFNQWVYGEDLPVCHIKTEKSKNEDGTWSLRADVTTDGVSPDFRIDLPIEMTFAGSPPKIERRRIHGGHSTFEITGLPAEPNRVIPNPQGAVLLHLK